MPRREAVLTSVALLFLSMPFLATCSGESPTAPTDPTGPPLGEIEDNRVIFNRSELSVINAAGVLLNLVATDGHVGIRFYKDFGFGGEQETNPWHMGFIEGVPGYQGLAILRDWLFTSALGTRREGCSWGGSIRTRPPTHRPPPAFRCGGRWTSSR